MGRSRALFGSKWRLDPLHPSECCDNLGDRSYRAMQRVSVLVLERRVRTHRQSTAPSGSRGKRWRPGRGRVSLSQGVF